LNLQFRKWCNIVTRTEMTVRDTEHRFLAPGISYDWCNLTLVMLTLTYFSKYSTGSSQKCNDIHIGVIF